MRFKTYLTEASNPLAKYRKNLDIMIDKGIILYRGMKAEDAFKIAAYKASIPSSKGDWKFDVPVFQYPERKEQRGSKIHMNLFLDLASMWEGFPSRRYSAFATQKAKHAGQFGKLGIMIPADSVELYGYSPTDFNESRAKSAPAQHRAKVEEVVGWVQKVLHSIEICINMLKEVDSAQEFRLRLLDAKTDYGVEEIDAIAAYRMNYGKKAMRVAELVDWSIRYRDRLAKMQRDSEFSQTLLDFIDNLKESLKEQGFDTVVDLFKSVSPEKYKAKSFTSLAQIPPRDTASETWFVGDFLFVQLPLNGDHYKREDIINVLKQIRDQA